MCELGREVGGVAGRRVQEQHRQPAAGCFVRGVVDVDGADLSFHGVGLLVGSLSLLSKIGGRQKLSPMGRVDRVMDVLDFLRARDVTHLDEMARALRVSTRTVLRDLATLRDRGWPIRADTGPGGGIRLERDRGVAAVHLTVDELASLWLA